MNFSFNLRYIQNVQRPVRKQTQCWNLEEYVDASPESTDEERIS